MEPDRVLWTRKCLAFIVLNPPKGRAFLLLIRSFMFLTSLQNDFLWMVLLSWRWKKFKSDGGYQVWESTVELHTGFLMLCWQCPDLLECSPGPDTTAFHILLFSHLVVSNSLRPQGPQHARLPCLSLLKLLSIASVIPSNLCCPALLPLPSIFSSIRWPKCFQRVGSLHQVASVSELQHQSSQWIFRVDIL